ncbi:MAG: hypothetical protein LBD76_03075 [Prevotellaceae bacterium]|jgi:hypothetical protein|nr:hypothetical protein [Prevotellaceae bacterium]
MAKVRKNFAGENLFPAKNPNTIVKGFVLTLLILSVNIIRAEKLDYFFDKSIVFDSKIPTPEQFLGYEIGTKITEHHRINAYLEKLAELSDRAEIIEIGRTHEGRKLEILIVSSPANISKLDAIKGERRKVRNSETVNTPLIVFLGYSVHGNETSASEASLLSAYYLVAAQNDFVQKELEGGIYFIDPVRNPDGQERFALWVNSNAGINVVNSSPFDREHTEGWPRGRGNHYWFDLNRDWINIVNPESRSRVAFYQDWLPHVQADHHEMGAGSTFFFEPTNPDGNESRFVPQSTYKLNAKFAVNYSKALDKIGSFYYTKEEFDNKNPNFGSTYPDYNGGVGILFEQASSRGIQQTTDNGLLTFAFTLRNQLVSSIATVDAANENRDALFDLQKEFFSTGLKNNKSYIVGDAYDAGRLNKFVNLLLAHRLDVYENNQDVTVNGIKFEKGKSYIIPVGQPNSALIQIIFDDKKGYEDANKLGYGAGFSIAYSTGLSHAALTNPAKGEKVETAKKTVPASFSKSNYAYIIDYRESKSQQLLFRLLEKDLIVKAAFQSFSINTASGTKDFPNGTLLIPVSNQPVSADELFALLKDLSVDEGVNVESVATGYSVKGVDLGSSSFRRINTPKVLIVTGGDVSSTEAGEVWHLFDQKLKYPIVKVESGSFGRVPLHEFNRIVFAGGAYSFLTPQALQSLKNWINDGGTLITISSASRWALSTLLARENNDEAGNNRNTTGNRPSAAAFTNRRLSTSIFETRINLKHPLGFGLTSEVLPVIKESFPFIPLEGDTINPVSRYADEPLLNGHLDPADKKTFRRFAPIKIRSNGGGNVILFAEDPVFRGTWDATERTFINAILLGDRIGGGFRFY